MPATLCVLKKRRDFLACARGRRWSTPGFLLQGHVRPADALEPETPVGECVRIGFTCSKKVGNAVTRNRAKRRLREVARQILPEHGKSGWDYVLIGFADTTVRRSFEKMTRDMATALQRIHEPKHQRAKRR